MSQILILDRHRERAEIMALNLRARGYSARAFISASAALKAIGESDILVVDYHLPEMTGLEVARRAYIQGWRGSFLLMSGNAGDIRETVEHPLLRIMLDKPFSVQTLVQALPGKS